MIAQGILLLNWLRLLRPSTSLASSDSVAVCFRGPPRSEGDRPRFGDRDGYRGGPRGGDVGGEKGGAPADYQPSFQVISLTHHPI